MYTCGPFENLKVQNSNLVCTTSLIKGITDVNTHALPSTTVSMVPVITWEEVERNVNQPSSFYDEL